MVAATPPITLSGTFTGGDTAELEISTDQGATSLTLGQFPALISRLRIIRCSLAGAPIGPTVQTGGSLQVPVPAGGGIIRLAPGVAPTLAPVAAQSVQEGQSLQIQLVGADADSVLTYSVASMPPLPTNPAPKLDALKGLFQWTPGYDVASKAAPAVFAVMFAVSDGFSTATANTMITVTYAAKPVTAHNGCSTGRAPEALLSLPWLIRWWRGRTRVLRARTAPRSGGL